MNRQKAVRYLTCVFLIPFMIFVVSGTVNSLLRTTYFDLYQIVEIAKYKWDNPLFTLIAGGLIIIFLCFIARTDWFGRTDFNMLAMGFGGMISLCVVLLFRCGVKCDSEIVSDISVAFLQGNYEAFAQGGYLYCYPFQLGVVAFIELLYKIFGVENYMVFQLLNVICIMNILGRLNRITAEMFEDERLTKLEALLSLGMLPLFLYATFIYGDIYGWCMGINAVYFMICYLKTDNWKALLKAAIFLAFGVLMKSNINILVVAAVLAIVLHALEKRNLKALLGAAGLVLVSQSGVWIVNGIYLYRTGMEAMPAGIPKIAWVAMSMQEPVEGGSACGWYNGYNWDTYARHDYNRQTTAQICMDNLEQSMRRFVHEQRYTVSFFYDKFTSQWNTPDFMAMITNEWYGRDGASLSDLAKFFIYGSGRTILLVFMNLYHFTIFFLSGVYCRFMRRVWRMDRAYFILNIFGGILFHMIWEAKARYVLGYFVLMLPIAAFGLGRLLEFTNKKLCHYFTGQREDTRNNAYQIQKQIFSIR